MAYVAAGKLIKKNNNNNIYGTLNVFIPITGKYPLKLRPNSPIEVNMHHQIA